jgi:hypothetical protein
MNILPVLILIGRPAAGKSEIIAHLKQLPPEVRRERFHLGRLDILDDFPMLWVWFEEDAILRNKLGQPALYTNARGHFKYPYLWHVLIERLSLEYSKRLRDNPEYHQETTTLVEFSRGSEHGGYRHAFRHLSEALLNRAAVLYIQVSFAESLRKNRLRTDPDRPDSILRHSLTDENMESLYRNDDWNEFSQGDPHYLWLGASRVPYSVFENEDDVTTGKPDWLEVRLKAAMDQLWARFTAQPQSGEEASR